MRVELEGAAGIVSQERLKKARICVHVLVAAAREVEDDEVVRSHSWQTFHETRYGVRRLKRRNDAFRASENARGLQRGGIGDGAIFGAALLGEPGVLGANGG